MKALIPQVDAPKEEGMRELPLEEVHPNRHQPRRRFDEEALAELADSIRQHGVLEPVIVRPVGDQYELVVGERRWRAAKLADRSTIPAVVRAMSDRDAAELALVENLQREDLNPIEEAEAYQRLLEEFGLTQEEVAQRVGRERSTVANRLRLLALGATVRRWLEEGKLSAGHARALLGCPSERDRESLGRRAIDEGLSVRQVEALVKALGQGRRPAAKRRVERDPHWAAIEDELRSALGTKVSVMKQGRRGKIEIEFYDEEDIDRIMSVLRGSD